MNFAEVFAPWKEIQSIHVLSNKCKIRGKFFEFYESRLCFVKADLAYQASTPVVKFPDRFGILCKGLRCSELSGPVVLPDAACASNAGIPLSAGIPAPVRTTTAPPF